MDAELLDPDGACGVPVSDVLARTPARAAPHAEELGCAAELGPSAPRAAAERQRAVARGDGLAAVVQDLAGAFVLSRGR